MATVIQGRDDAGNQGDCLVRWMCLTKTTMVVWDPKIWNRGSSYNHLQGNWMYSNMTLEMAFELKKS
jgi:hypothetical protein